MGVIVGVDEIVGPPPLEQVAAHPILHEGGADLPTEVLTGQQGEPQVCAPAKLAVQVLEEEGDRANLELGEHNLEAGKMDTTAFTGLVDLMHQHGYDVILETQDATAYQLDAVL
ncbi:MAG: hypothetical protein IH898_01230 [Planctomycetes bacterium]|nr:hypothetical protein [Planctomycetota bacterium]